MFIQIAQLELLGIHEDASRYLALRTVTDLYTETGNLSPKLIAKWPFLTRLPVALVNVLLMLFVVQMSLKVADRVIRTGVVELAGAIQATNPRKKLRFVTCRQGSRC